MHITYNEWTEMALNYLSHNIICYVQKRIIVWLLDSAECLNDPRGQEYFGTETNTEDNIECQRWDEQKPHSHELSRGFMGLPAPEHANYCRNPDNRDRPWCYTVNSTVLFQYCNIRECQERKCQTIYSETCKIRHALWENVCVGIDRVLDNTVRKNRNWSKEPKN